MFRKETDCLHLFINEVPSHVFLCSSLCRAHFVQMLKKRLWNPVLSSFCYHIVGFFVLFFFFQTIAVCAVNAAISKCGKIKKMQLGFSCYLHVCLGLRMILLRSHLGSFYKLFLYLVIHVSSKFSYIKCYGHLELLFFLWNWFRQTP